MASSSTSPILKRFTYDVFLSFKGPDVRKSFLDHLYHALKQYSIYTFKDDKRIGKGKKITDELIGAIQDSKFYIIVFSSNYASSSWCLEELAKIMECHNTGEHTAYPVFYDVEPTEVRHQSGSVGKAFAEHEEAKDAEKWRKAMKEAVDLGGWPLRDRQEAEFIQEIVDEIAEKLHNISFRYDKKLVGIERRVDDVIRSLQIGINDVRMIGIKAMGGAGKTTLAQAVFDKISFRFEGKSFVKNVKGESSSGLESLKKKILSDVLNDKDIEVRGVHGENMKTRMCGKKVLIVLDDVDDINQLEELAGEHDWFGPESRIIITTRNEKVVEADRVKWHDITLLSHWEAICLFSRYAFRKDIPNEGYQELSERVVRYADGLPLTIKVLGSKLCGEDKPIWEDTLEGLKENPLNDTLTTL